jgi:transketolase
MSPVTDTSQALAQRIRRDCLRMCHEKKASHLGGAFSVADVLAVLYHSILEHRPQQPDFAGRDRLFYSKGHACTALYAVLAERGFYPRSALDTFTDNGSYFTSHVNHKVPGVELSTGSLGHALSVAAGVGGGGGRRRPAAARTGIPTPSSATANWMKVRTGKPSCSHRTTSWTS